VTYTLAGIEGPNGWGIDGDTFYVMDELSRRGIDTAFRLGDRDLATCLHRTGAIRAGTPLSEVTAEIATSLGVEPTVLPASNDPVRTVVQVADGTRLSFQEYFVLRRHEDDVVGLEYRGAENAAPAPGVLDAIEAADLVVVAPSNPPLSVWPILAVPKIRRAIESARSVVAVSPLFGGKALKGPADKVMASLGLAPGTAGILDAYKGLVSSLVIDQGDIADEALSTADVRVIATDTRMTTPEQGADFGAWLMDTMTR
jgi:LPPG:FO 2-phospho-L-lactate transferase